MLFAGLDLSRKRLDVCVVDERRGPVSQTACPPDVGVQDRPVDARVLAELAARDLVPAIWLPDPAVRAERERARYRASLVAQRTQITTASTRR